MKGTKSLKQYLSTTVFPLDTFYQISTVQYILYMTYRNDSGLLAFAVR